MTFFSPIHPILFYPPLPFHFSSFSFLPHLHLIPYLLLPSILSADAMDLSTARLALNEVIIWLESKSTVQGSTGGSFKSPKKSLKSSSSNENVPSASRVSFRDSVYNEETVCALVERTKVAASAVIADRERLLSKQCAKLSELEKQLQESLLRGLIESGAQVCRYYYSVHWDMLCYDMHSYHAYSTGA